MRGDSDPREHGCWTETSIHFRHPSAEGDLPSLAHLGCISLRHHSISIIINSKKLHWDYGHCSPSVLLGNATLHVMLEGHGSKPTQARCSPGHRVLICSSSQGDRSISFIIRWTSGVFVTGTSVTQAGHKDEMMLYLSFLQVWLKVH